MAMTARELFDAHVTALPPTERLQLAALILDDLAANASLLEFSDTWKEKDAQSLMKISLLRAVAEERERSTLA